MTAFPAIASILSPEYLTVFVKERYFLSKNTSSSLLRTGINHSYLISDNEDKYVLRVYSYNWRTKLEIVAELDLLNQLKKNKIGISYPIGDVEGKYIQKINAPEGVRYALLFSFAKGTKIRFLTEEICVNIGMLMAKIHRITQNQKIKRNEYNSETLAVLPYAYAREYYSEKLQEMEFIRDAGIFFSSKFSKVS